MTHDESINYWAVIVNVVLVAEGKVSKEWLPTLVAAQHEDKATQDALAADYIRAIAAEILSGSDNGDIEVGRYNADEDFEIDGENLN